MATQGLKLGCPLSSLHYSLFTNNLGQFLNMLDRGAMTALQTTEVSHCNYADDIELPLLPTTSSPNSTNLHTHTTLKGLTLNAQKIKTMAFFCSNPPVFRYSDTLLENVQEFKYLGMTLSHNGKTTNASIQMARNFAGAIARVWRICSKLGKKNRKHAMLRIFKSSHSLQAYMDAKFGL